MIVWGWVHNTWPTAAEGGSAAYAYGAWINSCVHVVMYGYYGLTAMNIRPPAPLKKAVTTVQLTQFATCIVHALSALAFDATPVFYNAVQARVLSTDPDPVHPGSQPTGPAARRASLRCLPPRPRHSDPSEPAPSVRRSCTTLGCSSSSCRSCSASTRAPASRAAPPPSLRHRARPRRRRPLARPSETVRLPHWACPRRRESSDAHRRVARSHLPDARSCARTAHEPPCCHRVWLRGSCLGWSAQSTVEVASVAMNAECLSWVDARLQRMDVRGACASSACASSARPTARVRARPVSCVRHSGRAAAGAGVGRAAKCEHVSTRPRQRVVFIVCLVTRQRSQRCAHTRPQRVIAGVAWLH